MFNNAKVEMNAEERINNMRECIEHIMEERKCSREEAKCIYFGCEDEDNEVISRSAC